MGKYVRLNEHLARQSRAAVPMSFAEIERVIGAPLPASARKHRPWWSNNPNNSVITRAWLEAGYKTEGVDMAGETLIFRRSAERAGEPGASGPTLPADPLAGLYGGLRGTGRVASSVDLTQPVWDFAWTGE